MIITLMILIAVIHQIVKEVMRNGYDGRRA